MPTTKIERSAQEWALSALSSFMMAYRPTVLVDGVPHRRPEPEDYQPTPHCEECHLAWDETGGYKAEYRCPASPAGMIATIKTMVRK